MHNFTENLHHFAEGIYHLRYWVGAVGVVCGIGIAKGW